MSPIELEYPVTPQKFQAIRRNFAEHGVEVPDETSGEISQHGVTARFTYDGITLRLSIIKKPFLATTSYVTNSLNEFIAES